jgi:riboflavin kinase / FMN adenylyltransferase
MIVVKWDELLTRTPPLDGPVCLTVGVFDGLHLGHRRLIEGITAGPPGALPLVITFRDSPALRLMPGSFPGFILSYPQKLDRLASLGVGAVAAIDFSEELSNLSGKAFIGLLRENLTIQKIVVGKNFRFGKNRSSGTGDLREMLSDSGIEIEVTEPVSWGGGMVSSSRIRAALGRAEFADVRSMLASDYAIDLEGVAAERVDAESVRIRRVDMSQVVPPEGEYAVRCEGPLGAAAGRLLVGREWLTIFAAASGGATTVFFS